MKDNIGADVLLLLLGLYPCLISKELRIWTIEGLRFCLGGERLNEQVEVKVEPNEDITDHVFIFKMFPRCRHLIGAPIHLGVIRNTG
jgi:hypothetical protein